MEGQRDGTRELEKRYRDATRDILERWAMNGWVVALMEGSWFGVVSPAVRQEF